MTLQVDLRRSTEICQKPAFLNYLKDGTLLVSTYEQDLKNENHRNGTFQLFSQTNSNTPISTFSVSAGVFRFEVIKNQILTALTNGQLLLMNYNKNELMKNYSNKISNGMLLCAKFDRTSSQILCSDNFGRLFVIDKNFNDIKRQWKAHFLKYSTVSFIF